MQTTDRTPVSEQPVNELQIKGAIEPVIERYFATMNAQEYRQTAALFASDGIMHPPFESDIVGLEAIANYLEAEAPGMQLHPKEGKLEENSDRTYRITGKVKTPLFSVNVAWTFILNQSQQIQNVTIKLLASPQELLKLRSPN